MCKMISFSRTSPKLGVVCLKFDGYKMPYVVLTAFLKLDIRIKLLIHSASSCMEPIFLSFTLRIIVYSRNSVSGLRIIDTEVGLSESELV